MTFKISDHLIQYTDTGSVHYTSKVKLSEEYKMKLRMKKTIDE